VTEIRLGLLGEVAHQVTDLDTARALGSGDVDALATPRLIAWLEEATCRALDDKLTTEQTSVGTAVEIAHLRASAVGEVVRCRAVVASVDGAKVGFEVEAHQGERVVAGGRVTRAVVERAAFNARLAPEVGAG